MPRDDPARGGGSSTPQFSSSPSVHPSSQWKGCTKCHKPPPSSGAKLHVCAGCQMASYCNVECQRADWASHKLDCQALGDTRERSNVAQAVAKANGGRDLHSSTFQLNLSRFCH